MAEVALKPQGNCVDSLTLAWERPNGSWRLIQPGVAQGKIKVPPGNYRLYWCTLLGGGASAPDRIKLSAMETTVKRPVTFSAGKLNTLACGAPLEVKVTAAKTSPFQCGAERNPGPELVISARVVEAEGEVYRFFLKGEWLGARPSKPTFRVLDGDGSRLASGNLEYGQGGIYAWDGTCSCSWRVPGNLIGKKVTVAVAFDLKPLETTCKPVEAQL